MYVLLLCYEYWVQIIYYIATMSIPPFPSHDLAKLVLGYLAEEQLMTAYDEFLEASPYLDVLRNEYDRIFMTSLKNILAEYRAVKIYVETCKPFALRRRLFGCTNLLEVVKFLVNNIDVNKLNVQETTSDTVSSERRNTTMKSNPNSCAECNSLQLASCVCKSRNISQQTTGIQCASNIEGNTLQSSVETTALEDLPGTHVTRKKVRVLEKENKVSLSTSGYENTEICYSPQVEPMTVEMDQNSTNASRQCSQTTINQHNSMSQCIDVRNAEILAPSQRIVKFHEVLNIVSDNNTEATKCTNKSDLHRDNVNHSGVSTAGTFQDFSTGVNGSENRNNIVPDSSTSENLNVIVPSTKETNVTSSMTLSSVSNSDKTQTSAHIFIKVGTVKNNNLVSQSNNEIVPLTKTNTCPGGLRPKSNEHKITILSDIKVDKTLSNNNHPNIPAVLKNATSTPLMQMQTITINGTPAYKQDSQLESRRNYTRDEIMAMPTIILVPPSGPSPSPATRADRTLQAITSSACSTSRSLEPLVIDVTSNSPALSSNTTTTFSNMPTLQHVKFQNNTTDSGMLIKTVDLKNASVPKDNVIMETNKSTPQMLPPLRKASSTPRRTGHVRVLDFTTPRRILEETIIEHTLNQGSNSPVELIVSRSPNLHTFVDTTCSENVEPCNENIINNIDSVNNTNSVSIPENNVPNVIQCKKYNWDADLRALAIANENDNKSTVQKPKPKCGKRRKVQANSKVNVVNKTPGKTVKNFKKCTQKPKSIEALEEPILIEDTVSAPIKPTINIINGPDWNTPQDNDKSQNESNEGLADTPEMDRVSLQNAIGAKLNISDLLETPYKQALYDIQMETPRFLGPDLPGEPLSDIKIMNIPTPRFLNTPKPVVATPSSYSSRPTDYSSGGSYYKPDDQDYMRIEDIEYPVATSKESTESSNVEVPASSEIDDCKTKVSSVKTRPVRNCTKNVSYFNHNVNNNKTKEADEKLEVSSSCSESISVHSSNDIFKEGKHRKPTKEPKSRLNKSEIKKKNVTIKKRKTPVKKETPKSFMKIKPRRPTPIKDNSFGRKKKMEVPARKRTNSKEKNMNLIPTVTCVPTKSRRKSSTPRKLHCTKTFNSESSGHNSPELISKPKQNVVQDANIPCAHDSDTEQLPLRWSDDGSQDAKSQEIQINNSSNEPEDISKIKEFIADTDPTNTDCKERESNLHVDLVKRGFDIETAKIIERDLLDTPPHSRENATITTIPIVTETQSYEAFVEKEKSVEPQGSTSSNLTNAQDEEEEEIDEVELSVHECNEDTDNYISCQHDDTKDIPETSIVKLKDKFSVEVCIDDGVAIRLRATPFTILLDQDPVDVDIPDYAYRETEMAVDSISNIDKLYTPMKDPIRATCYEIFDSTLTSLDTPLKVQSPKRSECKSTIAEIVLEVEKIDDKEKSEPKKRKRLHSGEGSDESTNEMKRPRPEPHLLLQSAHIQNIDIETVLYKLHGP